MKDIRIITKKCAALSLDAASRILMRKNIKAREQEIAEAFKELAGPVQMRLHPKAALVTGRYGRADVLYAMLTAGNSVSRLIEKYISENKRLKADVADAMAESCLLDFEKEMLLDAEKIWREEGYENSECLKPLHDIPAGMQKEIYEMLDAGRTLGLPAVCGDRRNIPKFMCRIYKPGGAAGLFVQLQIEEENPARIRKISCPVGSSLLHVLQENEISLSAYCGGSGICGKCAVTVREGELPATAEDKKIFSEEELLNGRRLACKAVLQSSAAISLTHPKESEFEALGSSHADDITLHSANKYQKGDYGIGIDIGTTTLAFSLLNLQNGKIADTYTAVNPQRRFGADVISRIQSANSGKKEQMQTCIREALLAGIKTLTEKNITGQERVCQIAIAANTVMLHLLRGYSCEGFCRYPFAPEKLALEELTFEEAFGRRFAGVLQPKVTLLPGFSAFVGADIAAGIYACGIRQSEKTALFLDLGTNGEMALKTGAELFVTSAAAGPAFEGGNIRWGTGSVPGAISKVEITDKTPRVKTISDAVPKGICGTGVIETAAELYTAGIIDETGKLLDLYFEKGYPLAKNAGQEWILFTQQDIREVQMAKAAIRAGIEILLLRSGTLYETIDKVWLAGGFGYFLDVKKAAAIGILPEELEEKTTAAGNTSLRGALMYLMEQNRESLLKILENTTEISLADEEKFQELYLNYMMF